jgi:DNA-directed RNA polymerase subunit RPC12/RpoP
MKEKFDRFTYAEDNKYAYACPKCGAELDEGDCIWDKKDKDHGEYWSCPECKANFFAHYQMTSFTSWETGEEYFQCEEDHTDAFFVSE